jgi:hypothetical protein
MSPLQQSCQEEQARADWLTNSPPDVTRRFVAQAVGDARAAVGWRERKLCQMNGPTDRDQI